MALFSGRPGNMQGSLFAPEPVRLIIAGSRGLKDARRCVDEAMERVVLPQLSGPVGEIATGYSGTVDLAGHAYGLDHGYAPGKTLIAFPYPTAADVLARGLDPDAYDLAREGGGLRNGWLADWAAEVPRSALLLIWTGATPGSRSMRGHALRARLRLFEKRVTE